MASLVYFRKESEDGMVIRYSFGEDPAEMMRLLIMNTYTRTAQPDDGDVDYTFLKASRKINAVYDERAQWPERGMSAS
ncbi:hypothetical protein [Streptomyces sp. SID161]|uniref:hypothetical protein n=1 Tax=Streptomyces sp. SID161 TaxID=2690251 RepID=UPI00136B8E27|nr:hypothetical protein [Streptomyces sp. SID161]MYW43814.1 hypothetical protein [Streptomyces sp. SID161]